VITLNIAFFYLFSGLILWIVSFNVCAQLLKSLTISILIIFINAEFWEIPIFLMGYLGAPGYSFPHVLNHIIVGFMAALLILITKFKVNFTGFFILSGNLALNFMFLLFFPGVVSAWILRALSLISLSFVFLWSVKKNG
jgi:hypothetical protein